MPLDRSAPRVIQTGIQSSEKDTDLGLVKLQKKVTPYPQFTSGFSLLEEKRRAEEVRLLEEAEKQAALDAKIAGEAAAIEQERALALECELRRKAEQDADDHNVRVLLGLSTPKTRGESHSNSRSETNAPTPNTYPEAASDPYAAAAEALPRSVTRYSVSRRHTREHNDALIERSILQDSVEKRDPYEALVDAAMSTEKGLLRSVYNSRARARLDSSIEAAKKINQTHASSVEAEILKDTDFDKEHRVDRVKQEKIDWSAKETDESVHIQWAIAYVHATAANIFSDAITEGRQHQLILEKFTPFVCRKLAAWRVQASRAAFTMSRIREVNAPTLDEVRRDRVMQVVKHASNAPVQGSARNDRSPVVLESLFKAWPDTAINEMFGSAISNQLKGRSDATVRPLSYRTIQLLQLRDAGHKVESLLPDERPLEAGVRSYRAGEYIFFAGDRDSELFYIERGAVELIAVRDSRSNACSNGRVGDIVDATLGPLDVKRKSKAKENGVVVEVLGPHDYFGEPEVLLGGSRSVSALCTMDTNVFVFTRHAVYTTLSTLPVLVVDSLRAEARRRREEQCKRSFPMLVEDLRREPRLVAWDVQALGDLASRFVPVEFRRGAGQVDTRNQSLELSFYFVVSGKLAVTAETTVAPVIEVKTADGGTVYAPDSLPLIEPTRMEPSTPTEPRSRRTSIETQAPVAAKAGTPAASRVELCRVGPGEFYGIEAALLGHDAYDRQHVKNVRVEGLEDCVTWMIPRLAFSDLAILHPVGVVDSRNMLNKAYAASLVRPPSSHVPVLRNDPLLRYLCPAVCIQKVWDQIAQPRLLSAGDAICRSGETMSKPALFVVTSGCVNVRSGLDVNHPTSDYVVIRDTPSGGYVVGGFEFGTRSTAFADSVTCVSTCHVWVVDRVALEAELINTKPMVWSRMTSHSVRETLLRRHAEGTLSSIMEELYRPCDAR